MAKASSFVRVISEALCCVGARVYQPPHSVGWLEYFTYLNIVRISIRCVGHRSMRFFFQNSSPFHSFLGRLR